MKKSWLIAGGVVLLLVIGYLALGRSGGANHNDLITQVARGEFRVEVTTTGELEAKSSIEIMGPQGLRQIDISQLTVVRLEAEGKQVEKGDFVAQLDPGPLQDKIREAQTALDQSQSQYDQTRLDTALELRAARDEIQNLRYALRNAQLEVEQSGFEPPATQERVKMELEKAEKALEQALETYQLKKEKARAQIREAAANMREDQAKLQYVMDLQAQFTIFAPEPGMLIYHRNWDGQRVEEGSSIFTWRPVVAQLPDLSTMVSNTYVNEVDIRKVQVGQPVQIGLDAYPDKKLTGRVTRVANVGEKKQNSDAKVFEVVIEVDGEDMTLRPAMTTSNVILTEVVADALYIPLECLHSQGDTLSYVYLPRGKGATRQQVRVGTTNANEAIVLAGLEEGQDVMLSIPASGRISSEITMLKEEEQTAAR